MFYFFFLMNKEIIFNGSIYTNDVIERLSMEPRWWRLVLI